MHQVYEKKATFNSFYSAIFLQKEEYECSVSELLTSIDWDKSDRGVGWWNNTMEFYQALLEKLELEMEVKPFICYRTREKRTNSVLNIFFTYTTTGPGRTIGDAVCLIEEHFL